MDTVELITNILSVPTEHLYGVTVEQIFKRIGGSDQKKLNNAIADAIADFFKHGDIGEIYQDLKNLWYEDLKHSRIPLNRILTFVGLLESLTSHYPGLPKEKLDDAARKIHPYMVSKLVDDPRAEAFIKELKDEAGRKEETDKQAKRDAQAYDTNKTVHDIQRDVSEVKNTLGEMNETIKQMPDKNASQPQQPASPGLLSDNQDYIKLYEAPLFLDRDNKDISLKNLYVSPKIQGSRKNVEDVIADWAGDADAAPCLLLYGAAGIGKTSLVAKLIADAEEKQKSDPDTFEVLAITLRKHMEHLKEPETGEELLALLFGADETALKNKLLILDGLDEVCVLTQDFDGADFLRLLSELEYGFHILVTSRGSENNSEESCYFRHPSGLYGLQTETLSWTKEEVSEWCRKYRQYEQDSEIRAWCESFPEKYNKLNEKDKRREIFCVPFILYLCCKSKMDMEKNDSVGKVYDDVFRNILLRKHISRQGHRGGFGKRDRRSNLVAWQYAKEIAYQMFLIGKLDLSEEKHAEQLKNARNRTILLVNEKIEEINGKTSDESRKIRSITENDMSRLQFLAVFLFARESDGGKGIAFVHKTVYQYFTAVKLYEDYFAKFNASYFGCKSEDEAAEDVIKTAIAAFRYTAIPNDIFQYLCVMKKASFSNTDGEGFDMDGFKNAFVHAMENGVLDTLTISDAPEKEYFYRTAEKGIENPLNIQIVRSFRALLCFLTGNGFRNEDNSEACKQIREMLVMSDQIVNLKQWNLQGANLLWAKLQETNLQEANLQEANLLWANLQEANLLWANLQEANLLWADLRWANLLWANLQEAKLQGADLQEADLQEADLQEADLQNANLQNANLQNADLQGAKLQGADLQEANLQEANLLWADLQEANLQRANLQGADLRGADLRGANLLWANLQEAKLQGADLQEADLQEADLQNANLQNANLQNADLQGADLQGADLQGADLQGAKYCTHPNLCTIFPDGFNPKEHGMIEVDMYGNPVE